MTKRKETYLENKKKKVGETCICPICGEEFVKKQYSQAFCCGQCKDKYWNDKKDRHSDINYHKNYNMKHLERLERVGIYKEDGKFGHYDEDGNFWSFEEEAIEFASCENPIEGR